MSVDEDKKKAYKPVFLSAGLAVFLTGVTEPIEFMFMFIAPVLYVIYAVLTGVAFALADVMHLRIHAFGAIELLTRIPLIAKAGLIGDLIRFIGVCVFFFFLNFFTFRFVIKSSTMRHQVVTGTILMTSTYLQLKLQVRLLRHQLLPTVHKLHKSSICLVDSKTSKTSMLV